MRLSICKKANKGGRWAYESCPLTTSFWIELSCAANSCREEALSRYRKKKTSLRNQFQLNR